MADLWTVENSVDTRFEINDNILLAPKSSGNVSTLSLTDSLNVSRQTEAAATRVNSVISAVRASGPGGDSRIDGRLGVTQSLTDSLNTFGASALYAQDFNNSVQSADVTVGRGRRRTTTLGASAARALSERLSASAQLSYVRAGYGQRSATDYDDTGVNAGLSYALSDTDSLGVQGGHSEYRTLSGGRRSTTDSINLSASRALSERSSGSLSLGTYRTRTSISGFGIACPLATAFCDAGLVAPVVYPLTLDTTASGLQYSASLRHQFDERTSFSFSAGRQQSPSGAGTVVRNDSINASATRAFSETANGSVSYAQSRSTLEAAGGGQSGQRSLSFAFSKQLAPDLTFGASYQRTASDPAGARAHSNAVAVSLRLDWPQRLELTR